MNMCCISCVPVQNNYLYIYRYIQIHIFIYIYISTSHTHICIYTYVCASVRIFVQRVQFLCLSFSRFHYLMATEALKRATFVIFFFSCLLCCSFFLSFLYDRIINKCMISDFFHCAYIHTYIYSLSAFGINKIISRIKAYVFVFFCAVAVERIK